MALDCFKMSFCLLGINTADLYNATELDGDTLVYQRTKTKDRRADHAEIHVKIPPYIKDIVSKYRDNERVFVFHRHYANMKAFNKAVNIGLKSIGNELGIDNLEYYAARHSMATIAVNDVLCRVMQRYALLYQRLMPSLRLHSAGPACICQGSA